MGDRTTITPEMMEFRRKLLAIGFGAVGFSLLAFLGLLYAPFVRELLWAAALAVLFYPLHQRLFTLTGRRATLATLLTTVAALALVFVPAGFLLLRLLGEIQDLWPRVRGMVGPAGIASASEWLRRAELTSIVDFFSGGPAEGGIEARLQEWSGWMQDWLLERLRAATRGTPAALYQGTITVLAFFFFLRHGPAWIGQLEAALPLDPLQTRRLTAIAGRTVNAVFRGVLVTAAAQAGLAGAGYVAAGLPFPMLLASVTFVAALIPFVGPVAVWLPSAIGLFASGRHGAAIGLTLWGLLVVSLIDNFLRPYLIGRGMKLPLFWLFLSILGGLQALGFLGIVVGPAVLALTLACLRMYQEARATPDEETAPGP